MSIQNLIMNLQKYWADQGCYLAQPYDVEVGAGTMTPDTFFRVLDARDWKVAYVQPSRRPDDGRYGENPNRVQKHHQYQVIIKPSPDDIQKLYIESLTRLGLLGSVEGKFVQGENIAQTYPFVSSGNAELGFVALSPIVEGGTLKHGSAWIVPSGLLALFIWGHSTPLETVYVGF